MFIKHSPRFPQVGLIEFLAVKPQQSGVMGLNTENQALKTYLFPKTTM